MANKIQLKYDELDAIMKKMRSESDDVALILSRTRQMVQNIQQEWIGQRFKRIHPGYGSKAAAGIEETGGSAEHLPGRATQDHPDYPGS